MTNLTLELSDETLQKLTQKAQADDMDVTAWVHQLIETALDEADDDDDDITFSKAEILNDIREGIIDVLNGDYGRPAREFLDELRREKKQHANED